LGNENSWTSGEMEQAADATGFNWRDARLADKFHEIIKKRR